MNDTEFNDLLDDLRGVGLLGPLSRFGSDLDDVVEAKGKNRNGAKAFFDPKTGVKYVSHTNGYVRRYVPTTDWGRSITSSYCLNQRKEREEKIIDGRKYTSGVFVLLDNEEDRLRLIARGVRNYRKTMGK
jgi:hypothetical protein